LGRGIGGKGCEKGMNNKCFRRTSKIFRDVTGIPLLLILIITASFCYGMSAGELAERAVSFLYVRHYQGAIEHSTKALEAGGLSAAERAKVLTHRGVAYGTQQRYDKAIEDFTMAIELSPKYANAYTNRGGVYAYKQQYTKAIEDYGTNLGCLAVSASASSTETGTATAEGAGI